MSIVFCLFFFFSLLSFFPSPSFSSTSLPPVPPYQTLFFDQTLDHFDFRPTNPPTFKQRVLFADQWWGTKNAEDGWGACPGPIFFYTGNESPVTDYYENSGQWTQVLAPQYGALLVFAEHRYFGLSLPYGNSSFLPGKVDFLSTHQALADYANVLGWLKTQLLPQASECPVVSFGGSYGGMLSAWFRLKYPHVVIGSLAASAPFAFIGSGVSPFAFTQSTTATFENAVPGCSVKISQAYKLLSQLSVTDQGRKKFQQIFKMCDGQINNQSQAEQVVSWITGGLQGMCMLDYPYPTNYGISLPGWPVNKTCDIIVNNSQPKSNQKPKSPKQSKSNPIHINTNDDTDGEGDDDLLLAAFAAGIGVFYNNTGKVKCYDIAKNVPDWGVCCGWDYLACTDVYLPQGSNGMFPYTAWNLTADSLSCQQRFGVTIRPNWSLDEFGGLDFSGASNIIFSNGLLDPWHSSGVLNSLSDSLIAVVIPASAHHLDLRAPNAADPIYVQAARQQESEIIGGWLRDHKLKKSRK